MNLPNYTDFVWVRRPLNSQPELAYFIQGLGDTKGKFQNPYTLGDREGLSVEYFTDVIAWRGLEPPSSDDDWITI